MQKHRQITFCVEQMPITEAARSKAQPVSARFNAATVGSSPNRGIDVCVQVAALRRADPPSKEFYRLCMELRN
jgi:hypothetical protein